MPTVISSKYAITDEIGEGNRGKIYKGRHLNLEKDIVLKADKHSLSETTLENIMREVNALKDLSHTYIPQVFDFVFEGGIYYTIMDYIDGESLDKPLRRGEKFTSPQVIKWARQLLEALCYLHSSHSGFPFGILHSDIKPANIMRTKKGDIRLIDFNIALALDKDGGVAVGLTPGYASPEHYEYVGQAPGREAALVEPPTKLPQGIQTFIGQKEKREHKQSANPVSASGKNSKLDARSDIYGLGALLYHLVSGRVPARKAIDVTPLTDYDCAPALAAIINKAMFPDKEGRFQTAEEMLEAFIHFRWNIHWNDPRAKRFRMVRASMAAALAFLLLVGALATFAGIKRLQWDEQARASVEESLNAYFIGGDKTLAIKLALEAVPVPTGGGLFTSPVSAGAINALATALGVYDLSDGFKLHKTICLPSAPLMAEMSPAGKTAVAICASEAAIIDLESGRAVFAAPMARSVLAEARFLDDATLVCAGQEGLCAYDVDSGTRLWQSGFIASAVSVSADGGTIAAIGGDGGSGRLFDAEGKALRDVGFDGKRQRAPSDEEFANPRDSIFALSGGGEYLAASFADGSLAVFDTKDSHKILVCEPTAACDYVRFEGGFSGDLLAFSMTSWQGASLIGSDYAVIDMANVGLETPAPLFGDTSAGRYGVVANQDGIFISLYNAVVQLDADGGEPRGIARADSYVKCFDSDGEHAVVACDGCYSFFGQAVEEVSRFEREHPIDIALVSNGYAVVGGRDRQELTVLKLARNDGAQLVSFDGAAADGAAADGAADPYLEARVSADGSRVMLFHPGGFRLYSSNGALVHEQSIPSPEQVRDQQHSKSSGNLAVMYKDALLIYSGFDGRLVFEQKGLRSVFYAPYGVSILDDEGRLRLIDLDSGENTLPDAVLVGEDETFAAYCGFAVDSAFLAGSKLIGAAKYGERYYFFVEDGIKGVCYDGEGKKRIEIPLHGSSAEAHFTESAVIISPINGSPAAYSLKNGKKIADLEKDAYLTYVIEKDGYIACQYISTDGKQFGVLLDSEFQPIASLPRLRDVWDGQLVFDDRQGGLRRSQVYNIEALMDLAKASL